MRPPAPVLLQVVGDVLREQNVASIAAIHHAPRHVDPGPSYISALVHVDNAADRTGVHAHPQTQFGMFFERLGYLQRALHRRFRAVVKNKCHPVTGGNFDQFSRSFRAAEFICAAYNLFECVD